MFSHSFVGRQRELTALNRELERDQPSVVIVFGRRRVGKSRLLLEATQERPTIYYQATRVAGSLSLALFKEQVEKTLNGDPVLDGLSDWLGVLSYLETVAADRVPGLTVVLDEFPYLCDSDPSLPSVFQKFCDGLRGRITPMNLVLCGSQISFMEELLAEKNPMHGRQTWELDVAPLPFRDASQFFLDGRRKTACGRMEYSAACRTTWASVTRTSRFGPMFEISFCPRGRPSRTNLTISSRRNFATSHAMQPSWVPSPMVALHLVTS